MLAILYIKMEWLKENRTPNGAIQRRSYYKPIKIEDGVNLSGDGVFLKKYHYYQQKDSIFSSFDISVKLDQILYKESKGKAFTGSDEQKQRFARKRAKSIQKDRGSFCSIEKIDIPCIAIAEEPDNCYRIKWFDNGRGMPRRRGGNEDFCKKGARLAGQPNTLNETAFILAEGQAGVLKYNYRCTSYHGQWYECYYVYIVNDKVLTQNIFLRTYNYEYNQLADLF